MRHLVELSFLVTDGSTGELLRPGDLEKHVDGFTDHLVDTVADGISDVTVDAALAQGKVHVELWIEASNEAAAVEEGYMSVIPAILAAGGSLTGLNHPALQAKKERWENLTTAA